MNDMFSLKGKVIVVTGGTGVLGHAFVNAIADAGGTVAILGRNEAVATERANAINSKGGKAIVLIADVTKLEDLEKACKQLLEQTGRIDGLVNAAGGNMPGAVVAPDADIFNLNMEALKQVMDLNLFGTLLPTQVFGREIAKTGNGSIINISSMATKQAITKVLGYSMAKAAIDIYTKWFAVELANRFGDKIRMNAIMPGFFLTEQNRTLVTNPDGSLTARGNLIVNGTPFKRLGRAEELQGALVWLLSDAASFVSGTVVEVDGGFAAFSGV